MSTNEKIKIRIEECNVWGSLLEMLGRCRRDADDEISRYRQMIVDDCLDEDCWQNEEIAKLKIKLAACDSVEATILKAIG